MKSFLIANPKGGAGKSTLATNLAGYFARNGHRVMLGDIDRQHSSRDWLAIRPNVLPPIHGWDLEKDQPARPPKETTHAVLDTPAGLHGKNLERALKQVRRVIVPVQPSLFDILATRSFLETLLEEKAVRKEKTFVAVVGMRVEGVGEIQQFGSQYAMRIWLDPARLNNFQLTPVDVKSAIQAQNVQVSSGQFGGLQPVHQPALLEGGGAGHDDKGGDRQGEGHGQQQQAAGQAVRGARRQTLAPDVRQTNGDASPASAVTTASARAGSSPARTSSWRRGMTAPACSSETGESEQPDTPPTPPDPAAKWPIRISSVQETLGSDDAFEEGDKIGVYVVNRNSDGSQVALKTEGNYIDNRMYVLRSTWTSAVPEYWKRRLLHVLSLHHDHSECRGTAMEREDQPKRSVGLQGQRTAHRQDAG